MMRPGWYTCMCACTSGYHARIGRCLDLVRARIASNDEVYMFKRPFAYKTAAERCVPAGRYPSPPSLPHPAGFHTPNFRRVGKAGGEGIRGWGRPGPADATGHRITSNYCINASGNVTVRIYAVRDRSSHAQAAHSSPSARLRPAANGCPTQPIIPHLRPLKKLQHGI